MESQSRYADITRQGLGLIAVSYDAPATLKKFSDSRGITSTTATITGALEYQACDDKVCSNPSRIPISFVVALKGLERQPPDQ